MADPITWGLINIVKKGVKGVQTTLDGVKNSVDTLPEDVQTKLDAFEVTIDELKKNVEDTLADVQETVENSPAGVFPPDLFSLSAQSTEEGIKLTYQASLVLYTDGAQENLDSSTPSDKKVALSRTKAVMFRYSDIETPTDITEGNLAFVDYDLFIKNGLGHNATKQKTNTIVGLTQNKTYYISAFPISTNNVYNLNAGANGVNRTKCQWTGTKGTLTVNVTQDYDYKPLGEYTATMTPTAGGQAITKTQSGAATIVFSGLEAGEYTLSFSAPQYFTAPSSQSVTVTAGQSKALNAKYEISKSLSDYTWDELNEIGEDAKNVFPVGGTKDFTTTDGMFTFKMRLVHFNGDYLSESTSAKKANMSFVSDNVVGPKAFNDEAKYIDYTISTLKDYVKTQIEDKLPDELSRNVKTVYKYFDRISGSGNWLGCKIWVPRVCELKDSVLNVGSTEKNRSVKYSYYSSFDRLRKKFNDDYVEYWTSSRVIVGYTTYDSFYIDSSGNAMSNISLTANKYFPIGFCI